METGFVVEKKQLLADQVHDRILDQVVRTPVQSELILNEKNLSELFGVSRAPVREALIKLCGEGVLKSIPRLGYVVVQVTDQDLKNVMKMRLYLEVEGLKETIEHINDAMLDALETQITKAASKQNVDVWEVWQDNEEFHTLLLSFSGNNVYSRFLDTCLEMQKRSYAQGRWSVQNNMVDSVDITAHRAIYEHLKSGSYDQAIEVLRNDISWGRSVK